MNKIFMRFIAFLFTIHSVWSAEPSTGGAQPGSDTIAPPDAPVAESTSTAVSADPGTAAIDGDSDSTNVNPPPPPADSPTITDSSTTSTTPNQDRPVDSRISEVLNDVSTADGESPMAPEPVAAVDKEPTNESQTDEDEDDMYDSIAASKGAAEQLLSHLFGDAIDSFAGDAAHRVQETMTIDCTSKAEDTDFTYNIVTTLCPLLRSDGQCGQVKHPSYEIESTDKFCSSECRPQIDKIMLAFKNRATLSHKHEVIIFRDVAHSILEQYCSLCRPGCTSPRFN